MKFRWYSVRFRLKNGNAIDVISCGIGKASAVDRGLTILRLNHGFYVGSVRSHEIRWLRRGVVSADEIWSNDPP